MCSTNPVLVEELSVLGLTEVVADVLLSFAKGSLASRGTLHGILTLRFEELLEDEVQLLALHLLKVVLLVLAVLLEELLRLVASRLIADEVLVPMLSPRWRVECRLFTSPLGQELALIERARRTASILQKLSLVEVLERVEGSQMLRVRQEVLPSFSIGQALLR